MLPLLNFRPKPVFFFFFFLFFYAQSGKAQTRLDDSLSLVNLYTSCCGTGCTLNWQFNQPMDNWQGVTLLGNRVVEVNANGVGLSGTIPALNLTVMVNLFLSNNQLTGALPSFNGLSNLRYLHLDNNQFSSTLPNIIGMPNLESLYLNGNQLRGNIPNFSNIPSLIFLQLDNNLFTGAIPTFSNCPGLEVIYLQNNQLTGNIPPLSNLTNLRLFYVNDNLLEGFIPDFLSSSPSFATLLTENNLFTFEDIIDTYNAANGNYDFGYTPQNNFGNTNTVSVPAGSNYTIDLIIDDTVTTNTYYWHKDGILIDSTFGVNEYTITNFQSADVGVYTAKVFNSIATTTQQTLILYSQPINLNLALASANPTIPGLPNRVCANRNDTILFYRDPAFPFSSTPDPGGSIDSNTISTPNSTHSNAIITISNATNNEIFGFIPSRLPAGTNSVSISISYTTIQNSNPIMLLGGTSANVTIQIDSATPLDIDVPFNNVAYTGQPAAPHSYCRNDPAFSIMPQPNPIGAGVQSSSITGYGITLPSTVYSYDPSLVNPNIDVDTIIYSYTNQLGCTSIDTTSIGLNTGALTTITNNTTTYCFGNTSLTLTASPTGGTFSGPGVSGNQFSFQSAGPGVHTISYTLGSCSSIATKDFTIIAPPVARFTPPQAQYLTTDPPFQLFSQNDTTTGTYNFYGNPIINSYGLINPNTTPGPQTIYYSYDSLSCVGIDSASFMIVAPTPTSNPLLFTNNDPGAPALIEACVGSNVSFTYDDFAAHPAFISLPDKNTGNRFLIGAPNLTVSNQGTGTNSGVSGTVSFSIPNNAASGRVIFLDNSSVAIDTTIYTLVIHNPRLSFSTQPILLCADNSTINLNGFPVGGVFSGVGSTASAVLGNTFNPTQLAWPSIHVDSFVASIRYQYTPTYSDSTVCPQAIDTVQNFTVYDNRLDQVTYATLTQQTAAAGNQFLSLDTSLSNMVVLTRPNIRCNSNPNGPIVPCFPHQFSGTYVDQNNNFLSTLAPGRSLVQLQYNNSGCIGSATGFVDILGALVIHNLPDTLCTGRSVIFGRDTNLIYLDTTFMVGVDTRQVIRNQLLSTTTRNPSHASTINPIVASPVGQEEFRFTDRGFPKVIIDMRYQSLTTITDTLGTIDTIVIDTFTVTDSVSITGASAATLRINNLDSTYCSNDLGDTLFASLGFLGTSNNTISLFYNNTTISLPDNFFSPRAVYDSLVPSGIGDLSLEVRYQVNYYGCVQNMTNRPIITITAPQTPSFSSQTPYCQSDPPDNLQRSGLTSGVSESFFGSPAIDPSTGIFSPRLAGLGNNFITYSLIDTHACVYSFTDTIVVNDGPNIELRLDGSSTLDIFERLFFRTIPHSPCNADGIV